MIYLIPLMEGQSKSSTLRILHLTPITTTNFFTYVTVSALGLVVILAGAHAKYKV